MRSWTLGRSQGASSSVPEKDEPIDFFGDGIILVDSVAMGPKRRHTSLELAIGQPCQERVGAKGGFIDEARPVGGGNLRYDLVHDRPKAARREDGLDVSARGRSEIDQRL